MRVPVIATWVYVLAVVERGAPSIGDVLREALVLSQGEAGITNPTHVRAHLDQLAARGLVTSIEHDAPRRRVEWHLTEKGRAELERVRAHIHTSMTPATAKESAA